MVDEFRDTPGRADVAAGQREQLRAVLVVLRDRGPARGRAQRRPGPLPVLPVRRDHPRDQASAIRAVRWPSPTATCSTSTSSPRSARSLDIFGVERLPRHLGPRLLRGGAEQARRAGHVHRVRLRRLQRHHHAGGPGHAGQLSARPVGGDLRAVRRQGPGRQRHRRHDLPVERRLVEVPARRSGSTSTTPTPPGPTPATRTTTARATTT